MNVGVAFINYMHMQSYNKPLPLEEILYQPPII